MTDTTKNPANPAEDDVLDPAADEDAVDDDATPGGDGGGATESLSVEALQAELEQARGQYQRAVADYQNLERRSREERQEVGRFATADVIRGFLPVLDDLERAIEAGERENSNAAWLEGVRLVVQKFRGILQHHGVQEIHALGQPFDPNRHEAIGSAAGPDGQVVHLLQRGFMLNDRTIRPAMVMVGNGEDAPRTPDAEE